LRTAAALSLRGENRDLADAEVDALVESGKCMVIRVSDRLADHGVGGVVAFEMAEDSLVVEAMALSCPVLGKQAEYAVVLGLARIATERKCKNVVFDYRPAGRNQFMSAFLKSVSEEESQTRFVLPVGEAEDRIAKAAIAAGTWILEFGT
jgi:FkbH-like protein